VFLAGREVQGAKEVQVFLALLAYLEGKEE